MRKGLGELNQMQIHVRKRSPHEISKTNAGTSLASKISMVMESKCVQNIQNALAQLELKPDASWWLQLNLKQKYKMAHGGWLRARRSEAKRRGNATTPLDGAFPSLSLSLALSLPP